MGANKMPETSFGDNTGWIWNSWLDVVQFTAEVGGSRVICRVSRKCLEDHCGDPKAPGEYLDAAKKNTEAITHKVQLLIQSGRYESDSSILVRSSDW